MYHVDIRMIKNELAANQIVFARGENLYLLGSCKLLKSHLSTGKFTYVVSGGSTDYVVTIELDTESGITSTSCTCPYPHSGCKHVVASCLDIAKRIQEHRLIELSTNQDELPPSKKPTTMAKDGKGRSSKKKTKRTPPPIPASAEALMLKGSLAHEELTTEFSLDILPPYLLPAEIRSQALQSRIERAATERFRLLPGDSYIGVHKLQHLPDDPYTITIYDPAKRLAHCTCPDYAVNNLMTCKHLIFAFEQLDKLFDFKPEHSNADNIWEQDLPFVHITWNSAIRKPVCHIPKNVNPSISDLLLPLFNHRGEYRLSSLVPLFDLYRRFGDPRIAMDEEIDTSTNENSASNPYTAFRFDQRLLEKIDEVFFEQQVATIEQAHTLEASFLKTELYPYQEEGIRFAVFRRSAILADEMGLGKTIQAIATACLKREIFGLQSVLIICPASLKRQWKQEIEKFSDYEALLLEGSPAWRKHTILEDKTFFKIINYEMVLRDIDTIKQQPPDLVILDEAQRIKNFATKTHQAIKQIPRSHSLVLTGTPLENKLEDLYSIVQFCNPELLSPLWAFASQHYRLSRERGNKILGYHNLDLVHEKIKPLLLRRTKTEVFDSLPEVTRSKIILEPTTQQMRQHQGYLQSLQRIIRKKVLTPMDMQRIQKLLLGMRMVCDALCLVDDTCENTSSPKLEELESLLRDVVVEGQRKVIIFSEWTSMTALVGSVVSRLGLDFVEFSGKVPVKKRQLLIEEFRTNPSCMVFIATDAGGVGLNLQNCDFLVNMELPWNPAKLNQRIGRIHRIGQKSNKVHVVDMIMSKTIEEKIATGLGLKQDLFDAVFSGKTTDVDFNREGRSQFVNQIDALLKSMHSPVDPQLEEVMTKPALDEMDPHYLNPQLLGREDNSYDLDDQTKDVSTPEHSHEVDLTEEYSEEDLIGSEASSTNLSQIPQSPLDAVDTINSEASGVESQKDPSSIVLQSELDDQKGSSVATTTNIKEQREQLQAVLNQGLAFLNTLSQMSTGKALFTPGASKPIEIDAETGEVVMRFKLDAID